MKREWFWFSVFFLSCLWSLQDYIVPGVFLIVWLLFLHCPRFMFWVRAYLDISADFTLCYAQLTFRLRNKIVWWIDEVIFKNRGKREKEHKSQNIERDTYGKKRKTRLKQKKMSPLPNARNPGWAVKVNGNVQFVRHHGLPKWSTFSIFIYLPGIQVNIAQWIILQAPRPPCSRFHLQNTLFERGKVTWY